MADYYVNGDAADDTGDGSIGDPWKYLSTHTGSLAAGDTVYYRGGVTPQVHNETGEINLTVSGTSTSPITITCYQSENVELRNANVGQYIFDVHGDWNVIAGKDQLYLNKNLKAGYIVYFRAGADDCEIKDTEIANSSGTGPMILIMAHRTLVAGCEIRDGYKDDTSDAIGVAIWDGDDNIVEDCTIYDIKGDCVFVSDDYAVQGTIIRDNTLYTTLDECSMAAIDMKGNFGTQAQIAHNIMYGFRSNDSSCGGSGDPSGQAIDLHNDADDVLVEGNLIYDCTSGIVIDDQIQNIIVRRNVIRDLADSAEDPNASNLDAILIRGTNVDVYLNTFHNCPEDSIHFIAAISDVVIKNNIFNDCGTITGDGLEGWTADYNCWYNCTDTLSGANDVTSDPDFVDEAGNDFELEATSPCIDEGVYESPVDYYYGSAPDMGAFEYTADLSAETIQVIIWRSEGTGVGDDGDLMAKATAGAVTRTTTLSDYSTL